MNPILTGIAAAVIVGAIVAIAARDARSTILGLVVVLIGSPLLAEPMAAPAGLAARFIGAILAAYLLWIVVRDRPELGLFGAPTGGSRIGWPAEVLVAASAAVAGFAAHGLGAPAGGPAIASAAGFAIAAVSMAPVLTGHDVLRVGTGLLLLVDAGLVVRSALGGTPGPFEQLVAAALLVVLAGALGALAINARIDGSGGFTLSTEAVRRRREPDAHPLEAR